MKRFHTFCILSAICVLGCKPQVEVSTARGVELPECQGYLFKDTVDDVGYLTLTVIPRQGTMPDAASKPKSYLLTFKRAESGEGYRLDRAKGDVIQDVEPVRDTVLTVKGSRLCLDPGPGDTSPEQCLAAWIKKAGTGSWCQ